MPKAPNPVILRRPLPALFRVCTRFNPPDFNGTLFDTTPGATVMACASCQVIKIGSSTDGRKYVWLWVELPGVTCRVLYEGLGKLLVREGEHLKVDEPIGITSAVTGFRIARFYVEVRAYPGDVAVEPDWFDDYVDQRVLSVLPGQPNQ